MLVSWGLCLKSLYCSLDRGLLLYSFINLLMRKSLLSDSQRQGGVYSWLGFLERYFWIFEWGKTFSLRCCSQPHGCRWKSQVHLAKLPWESSRASGCVSANWISELQYVVNSSAGKNLQTIGNIAEYFLRLIVLWWPKSLNGVCNPFLGDTDIWLLPNMTSCT